MGQATLPGLPPGTPRWKQTFAWSVRKHAQWARCPRAFWFDTVAPTLPRPPLGYEAFDRLRGLSPLRVAKGQAVHDALQVGIQAAREGRSPVPTARLALDRRLRSFAVHPERTVVEVANGFPAPARDELESLRKEGRAMVERFFAERWPRYAGRRYVQHEEYRRLRLGGVRVTLRPDLVTAGPEGILISDWKTGRDVGEEGASLQLSCYTLWACRALGEPAERVAAELVFLGDGGATRPTARTAQQLDDAEAFIAASAATMLAVQRPEDAPARPSAACAECAFATACEAGKPYIPG